MENSIQVNEYSALVGMTMWTIDKDTLKIKKLDIVGVSIYLGRYYNSVTVITDDNYVCSLSECFPSKEALLDHLNGED